MVKKLINTFFVCFYTVILLKTGRDMLYQKPTKLETNRNGQFNMLIFFLKIERFTRPDKPILRQDKKKGLQKESYKKADSSSSEGKKKKTTLY